MYVSVYMCCSSISLSLIIGVFLKNQKAHKIGDKLFCSEHHSVRKMQPLCVSVSVSVCVCE